MDARINIDISDEARRLILEARQLAQADPEAKRQIDPWLNGNRGAVLFACHVDRDAAPGAFHATLEVTEPFADLVAALRARNVHPSLSEVSQEFAVAHDGEASHKDKSTERADTPPKRLKRGVELIERNGMLYLPEGHSWVDIMDRKDMIVNINALSRELQRANFRQGGRSDTALRLLAVVNRLLEVSNRFGGCAKVLTLATPEDPLTSEFLASYRHLFAQFEQAVDEIEGDWGPIVRSFTWPDGGDTVEGGS